MKPRNESLRLIDVRGQLWNKVNPFLRDRLQRVPSAYSVYEGIIPLATAITFKIHEASRPKIIRFD